MPLRSKDRITCRLLIPSGFDAATKPRDVQFITLPQNCNRSGTGPVLPSIFAVVVDRLAENPAGGQAPCATRRTRNAAPMIALLTLTVGLALAAPGAAAHSKRQRRSPGQAT